MPGRHSHRRARAFTAVLAVVAFFLLTPVVGAAAQAQTVSTDPSTTTATTAAGSAQSSDSVQSSGTVRAAATGQAGYWEAASDGGVYAFGAGNFGQFRPGHLNSPIVGAASTATGHGYWLVAADGGIFTYGDAAFHGSAGALRLNSPIVGMATTPSGQGYWLVAADGGIFTYGDAGYYGSTGGMALNRPVVGMAATADGHGYWLVASDGGIFTFGDASFDGSAGAIHLNRPVVGMAPTGDGGGYWLVASDGGIFTYGDAPYAGSTGGIRLNKPIVGMAPAPLGGYWLVATDGGLFSFGGAPYLGSTGSAPGPAPVVSLAATSHGTVYPGGTVGTDYSWPQCGSGPYGPPGNPVSIVGVNDGLSNTFNPCFASQAANAGANLTVYINTDGDEPGQPQALNGPRGACAGSDLICTGYNWGYNNAAASVAHVHALGYTPSLWWLDVEAPCGFQYPDWLCGAAGQQSNAAVIQGAIDAIHGAGLVAGIYSTYVQWPAITGGSAYNDAVNYPNLPIWVATVPSSSAQWATDCQAAAPGGTLNFAQGIPWLIQWLGGSGAPTAPLDGDLACAL